MEQIRNRKRTIYFTLLDLFLLLFLELFGPWQIGHLLRILISVWWYAVERYIQILSLKSGMGPGLVIVE